MRAPLLSLALALPILLAGQSAIRTYPVPTGTVITDASWMPDGGLVLSGRHASNGYLLRVDATGTPLWAKEYPLLGSSLGTPFLTPYSLHAFAAVVANANGRIFTTGSALDGQAMAVEQSTAAACNAGGDTLWSGAAANARGNRNSAIALEPAGTLLLAGMHGTPFGGASTLSRLSPDTNVVVRSAVWNVSLNGGGDQSCVTPLAGGGAATGGIFLADALITCLAPDLSMLWSRELHFTNPSNAVVRSIAATADGGLIAGIDRGTYFDLFRYDASGTLLWSQAVSATGTSLSIADLAVQSDGRILICGSSPTGAWAVRLTSGGALDFARHLDTGSPAVTARSLLLDPNGNGFAVVGWTPGQAAVIIAAADGTVGNCVAQTLSITLAPPVFTLGSDVIGVSAGDGGTPLYPSRMPWTADATSATTVCSSAPSCVVAPRVLLQGPYVSGPGLMHDSLRTKGLIPLTEPYTALGLPLTGGSGATTTSAVLAVSGNNAIVDWVLVELRSASNSSVVLGSRCALLQRDGDVVSVDGLSPLTFYGLAPGSYYLAIRHRNHLGVMTASALSLGTSATTVDFTLPATMAYGVLAQNTVNNKHVLWCGNAFLDGRVAYTGANNDRDAILVRVGSTTPNNTVTGYFTEDVTMDGQVRYTGSNNDRDPILVNVGNTTPNATRAQQLP